jgi:menaquinone-dependent protoporphyrinogen IX oxidase
MRIEIMHASKYGNGAKVAEELKRLLVAQGSEVVVHHIKETRPKNMPPADLYVFGSPGRIGKPIGSMRRFLKKVNLPSGTRYAIFSTESLARPNKKTGRMPTAEEMARWERIQPIMDELLQAKGLVKIASMTVHVTAMKGPLEDGWQEKVEAFASTLMQRR